MKGRSKKKKKKKRKTSKKKNPIIVKVLCGFGILANKKKCVQGL